MQNLIYFLFFASPLTAQLLDIEVDGLNYKESNKQNNYLEVLECYDTEDCQKLLLEKINENERELQKITYDCLSPLGEDDENGNRKPLLKKLMVPQCKHKFHVSCMQSWLEVQPKCPVCRADINF